MPVLIPLAIGMIGSYVGNKLTAKSAGQSAMAPGPTTPATANPLTSAPPTTAATGSQNTQAAQLAAIKQKRRARGTPPLMSTPGRILGGTAGTQATSLLGY